MRAGSPARGTAIAALAVLVDLMARTAPTTAQEEIARGRALAERLCAVCHMSPGQGEKQGINDVPGFVAIARRPSQTHEGIVAWLQTKPPMMPNHHLSQSEMYDLAAFILSLGDPSTAPGK